MALSLWASLADAHDAGFALLAAFGKPVRLMLLVIASPADAHDARWLLAAYGSGASG